jgi:hypothetical protein
MPRRFNRVANSSRAFAKRFVIVPFANPNDAAVCACFAGKVKGTPAFKAAELQAATIVAALTGK